MSRTFEQYKPRTISYEGQVNMSDWSIKIYTITMNNTYLSDSLTIEIKQKLPAWLNTIESSKLPVHKQAFIILHEAREGIWILLNWWTGGEMIQTKVYFSNYGDSWNITESPYQTSGLLCVWELEVFAHERAAWIKHVLHHPEYPQYDAYQKDVLNHNKKSQISV